MFQTAVSLALEALIPRLQSQKNWRASAGSLHGFLNPTVLFHPVEDRNLPVTVPRAAEDLQDRAPVAKPEVFSGEAAEIAPFAKTRTQRLVEIQGEIESSAALRTDASSGSNRLKFLGDTDARLFFLDVSSSFPSVDLGDVFSGQIAELLDKMLKAMGLERSGIFLASFALGQSETELPFRKHLEDVIRVVKPTVLVALGTLALREIQNAGASAGGHSGWLTWEDVWIKPTLHPGDLIQSGLLATKRQAWEDLLEVMEKVKMPVSAKQKSYFTRS